MTSDRMMQPKQVALCCQEAKPMDVVGLLGCAGLLCWAWWAGVVAFFSLGGNEGSSSAATAKSTQAATPTKTATKAIVDYRLATKVAPKPDCYPNEEPTKTPGECEPTAPPTPSENPDLGTVLSLPAFQAATGRCRFQLPGPMSQKSMPYSITRDFDADA